MLPYRISRALKPVRIGNGLFGRQNFDAAFSEGIESVCIRDVPVQRRGIELGEDKDLLQPRVQAVADRNIDQTILAAKGNGRLGSILCERKKSLTCPARQN